MNLRTVLLSSTTSIALLLQSQKALSQSAASVPQGFTITEKGANHRVWQKVEYEQSQAGPIPRVRQFKELATGMYFKRNPQEDWQETSETIELQKDGSAAALNGPHTLRLPADIYTGLIQVTTSDGQTISSRPLCLSYYDGTTNILISDLTNSVGQILPSGRDVIYTNCFSDISASLIVHYRRSGIE